MALHAVCQAFLNPGDEAILVSPFYDAYPSDVELAGAKPVYVTLSVSKEHSSQWKLDREKLEAAVSEKTRLLFINTPSNIPGKVFSREELQVICDVAKKHDLLVVSDEVYEFLTYDGVQHVRIASMPGMFERTITIGSAGKTFSATGLKIGWVVAPKQFVHALNHIIVLNPFSVTTPASELTALAFQKAQETDYFTKFKQTLQKFVSLAFIFALLE